ILFTLVLYSAPHHQHLHSFPTRRSSDLRQVSVLPRRGPLGAATAQSPLVVGNGARLDRSVLEAPADGSPLMGEPFLKTLTRTARSEEHTSELQSPDHLVCRLLLEKKKTK